MTDADSSSLDPKETSESDKPHTSYAAYLRSRDPDEQQATDELFTSLYPDPDDPIRQAYRDCRMRAYFIRHEETGEVRVSANTCKSRWCLPCSKARAAFVSANVEKWVRQIPAPKLLTLTLQSTDAPLAAQINSLHVCFRRLRKKAPFNKAWHGGVWFLQITFNQQEQRWHPHLHIILHGNYVDQRTIARKWLQTTYTSNIVDIRRIRAAQDAARYVARYVSRPAPLKDLDPSDRLQMANAFHGRRTIGTFGTARGQNLLKRPDFDRAKWHRVGSWQWVTDLQDTDERAHLIWLAWLSHTPLAHGVTLYDPWQDQDGLPADLDPEPPPGQHHFDFAGPVRLAHVLPRVRDMTSAI